MYPPHCRSHGVNKQVGRQAQQEPAQWAGKAREGKGNQVKGAWGKVKRQAGNKVCGARGSKGGQATYCTGGRAG